MPDTLYYNDGKGHIRQVPANKVTKFKKYFPGATPAREEQLSAIENKRAAQSEQEGKTIITAPKPAQIDTSNIRGQVSLPGSAPVSEVAKDVMNIHRYDPDISFRAKYGAYKEQPELFRDQEADITQTQLTKEAQAQLKSVPKENIYIPGSPTIGQPGFTTTRTSKKRKEEELESLQDFLTNTPQGRGFVELDEQRKKQLDEYDQQLVQQISELEKEAERAKREDYLRKIKERARGEGIEIPKDFGERDIEKAGKLMVIKPSDDIILAEENLSELKKQQAAIQDVKEGRSDISQFFREFGRRIPGALPTIASGGITELDKAIQNQFFKKKPGELATRSENLLSEYATIHQLDRSIAQDIAQGTVGSLEFMSQFAVAGGAVSGITKGIGKRILTEGAKKAVKGAGKTVKIAGKEISEALLQTAIMPATLANAVENNAENPGSFLDAYANSYLSNLVEVGSERVGAFIPNFQMKFLPESVQKLRRATGIQGAVGEFLEEQIATAGHAILGDQQGQWSDLVDPRQQLITVGVVGIIQLPYASINTAGYASAKYKNVKQKQSINKAYTQNIENMKKVFGNEAEGVQRWVDGIIDESFQSDEKSYLFPAIVLNIANSEDFDETQKDALIKYTLSSVAKNGMEKGKKEIIQQTQAEAQDVARQVINPETNSIIMAKVPEMEQPVLIQGNVVLRDDGTVDTSKSGEVYYTDANGKRKVIDAKFIEIVENVPADQAIQEITAAKTTQTVNSLANDEVRAYTPGETIRFTTDGTTNLVGQIQSVDQDGNYQVVVDGIPKPMMIEPRMIINEDNLLGVDNGVLVDYEDQSGNIVTAEVEDMSLRGNGIIVIGGEEVQTERVIGVHREGEAQTQSTDNMPQKTPESEDFPAGEIEQNVSKTEETTAESQNTPIYPLDKKGEPDFDNFTPEHFFAYTSETEGPEVAIRDLQDEVTKIEKKVAASEKKIAAASLKEKVKLRNDIRKMTEEANTYRNLIKRAQPTQASTEEVQETVVPEAQGPVMQQKPSVEPGTEEAITSTEQPTGIEENISEEERLVNEIDAQKEARRLQVKNMKRDEREKWWGDVQSLRELIMRRIINGQRIIWEDTDGGRGLGNELGFLNSKAEKKARFNYLAGPGKGITPEQLAENIYEENGAFPNQFTEMNLYGMVDDNDIRGEVIDVLNSYTSKGQMINAINEDRLGKEFEELDMAANMAIGETLKFDPNEESQNEMLRTLEYKIENEEVSEQEIIEYYENQVTKDEFDEYFYNFTTKYDEYDESGTSGIDKQTTEQGSESPDGEGRDQGSNSIEESAGEGDQGNEGEADEDADAAGPVGYGETDQEGRGENAGGLIKERKENAGKTNQQLLTEAEKALRDKERDFTRLQERYSRLKNQAEKDDSYGMAGQMDLSGNVAGSDNLFAANSNEINQGIRKIISDAKKMADEAGEEVNRASKEVERLKTQLFHEKIGQKDVFGEDITSDIESQQPNTNPTEGQKEAGNYKKAHINVSGFDITIENPKGSERSGTDPSGNKWTRTLRSHYGYFKRTQGKDGDQIDVFIGENPESRYIFVVDQLNQDGSFDEHKVMLGYDSLDQAKEAYLENYEEGWQGLGTITAVEMEDFRKWLNSDSRRIKPFAEYKQIQEAIHETEEADHPTESDQPIDIVKVAKEAAGKQRGDQEKSPVRDKEYRYELTVRPFGIGTYPTEGFIRYEDSDGSRYGYIVMDRKLKPQEWSKWDLLPTTEIEQLVGKTFVDSEGDYGKIEVEWEEGRPIIHYFDKAGEEIDSQRETIRNLFDRIESGEWVELDKEGNILEEPSENFAVNEKKRANKKGSTRAIQMQINWEAENGDVPAKRDEAISSDPGIADVQRTAGYDPVIDNRITNVERILTNQGAINFMGSPLTGPTKIQGANDVAFLFKNLESAASENVFTVVVNKDGDYRVLYQTTGSSYQSITDPKMIATIVKDFGATKIWMVHNHPSGSLRASAEDVAAHKRLVKLASIMDIEVMPSIIINLDSGKYVEFDSTNIDSEIKDRPVEIESGEVSPVPVYSFDRQKLYSPSSERTRISSPQDVALFLSQQKRGAIDKLQILILDRSNAITRYFLVDGKLKGRELSKIILPEIGRSGENVIIAGNGNVSAVKSIKADLESVGAHLLDVLTIKQDQDIINNYRSYANEGLLEEQAEYNKTTPATININGVEKPTTNSDGNPIASTEEGVRNFWKWFGDSKVVDSEGRPMVVYHGTGNKFSTFSMQEGAMGKGAYFTSVFEEAADYAAEKLDEQLSEENDMGGKWYGEYIIPVYLKIIDANNIARSSYGGDGYIYLATNPNQVKSVDNVGTFDPVNDDIRFSMIDEAGFYSTVEKALDEIKQEKGTVGQFKAMLLKNGAKEAEMEWMGWDDQFRDPTQKVTKDDVQDWIEVNNY